MFFKNSKLLFIFLIIISSSSCGLLKENNGEIKYKTTDFDKHSKPKQPTYLNLDDWLVHPEKKSDLTFKDPQNVQRKGNTDIVNQKIIKIEFISIN